jgi:alpha-glucosidase
MKKYLVVSLMLAVLPAAAARAEWTYLGDYVAPHKTEGNVVTFTCSNATVKVEVCTEDILRIRMSKSGEFKPNEPWAVIKYDWPQANFTVKNREILELSS